MSIEANKAVVRRYFKAIEDAEDDRVAAELVIRGGRIVEFHEHLDTLYAFRALFEPAGITEREQVTWMPGESGER